MPTEKSEEPTAFSCSMPVANIRPGTIRKPRQCRCEPPIQASLQQTYPRLYFSLRLHDFVRSFKLGLCLIWNPVAGKGMHNQHPELGETHYVLSDTAHDQPPKA